MQFAPGEQYRYNNSAYVLLGAITKGSPGRPTSSSWQTASSSPSA